MPVKTPFQILANNSPGVVPAGLPDRTIALNTADGRFFVSNSSGGSTDAVRRVGGNFTVDGTLTVNGVGVSTAPRDRAIVVNLDNGANAIANGAIKLTVTSPVSGMILSWQITSDNGDTGNISYVISKSNTTSFPAFANIGTVSISTNTIANGSNSSFSNAFLSTGDMLRFNVNAQVITAATLNIVVRES